MILIGVRDRARLERARAKIVARQVPHYAWPPEPGIDFGFSAIATVPLDAEQRQFLSHYRLLKFGEGAGMSAHHLGVGLATSSPVVQGLSSRPLKLCEAGSSPAGRTSTPCDQHGG